MIGDAVIAWEDSHGRLWQGDVRACLAAMEPESVQCVVTSPPYHGLRAYGTEPQIWGGTDPACDHTLIETPGLPPMTGGSGTASAKQVTNAGSQFGNAWRENGERVSTAQQDNGPGGGVWNAVSRGTEPSAQRTAFVASMGATCTRCGAWRGELGSEPTPELFVDHLVEVFRGAKRVLRPDGVLFCNLGDSYQDKQLVGAPWRFALAMQAAGWWLRGDYVWSKPNPMPESVTDRCTRSHEYVFHFSKASTYYWDADAIREPHARLWDANNGGTMAHVDHAASEAREIHQGNNHRGAYPLPNPAGRNARSVWEIATHPYTEAHFATFPPEIPRRAIRAGTSERGACAACGAPWRRVVEHQRGPIAERLNPKNVAKVEMGLHSAKTGLCQPGWRKEPTASSTTVGWAPTCSHLDADVVPCTVLDIFSGSGTSMVVARQLGRIGWGIELNPEYVEMSLKRLHQGVLL